MVDTINVKGTAHKIGGNQADGQWFRKQATVFTSQTWTTSGVRTFNVSNYLPDNDYVYEVIVSSYSTSTATAGSWDTWWVRNQDAQFDQYMSRNITRTASNVLCGESAIIPVQQVNGVLTLNINVTNTGTASAGLYLMGYRRLGGVKPKTYYTLTINPTPSDATVTFNKGTVVGNTCTVTAGTSVTYTVSKSGYTTQSGTVTVNSNQTVNVSLSQAGIPMYGYSFDAGFGEGDVYILASNSTSGIVAYLGGAISNISGTIGTSGSSFKDSEYGYTFTYNRSISVSGITLHIYRFGYANELAVVGNIQNGGHPLRSVVSLSATGITNKNFDGQHPTSVTSSQMVFRGMQVIGQSTVQYTATRKSSIDKTYTGA